MKRIRIISIIIAVITLLQSNVGFGQEVKRLSLDSSLVIAAKNNPQVKAAYTRYLAAMKEPSVIPLPTVSTST